MKHTIKPKTGSKTIKDIVSISDLSRKDIELVLSQAAKMESMPRDKKAQILKNKVVATLFFEPSTRTRLSFDTSAQNLGAKVIGFAEPNTSSFSKGESLSDTVRIVENYSDIIVMRHFIEGAAKRAAEISKVHIINAGDGANQHPTQTLLDLYTIKKEMGKIDGLKICIAGDLKYGRTVHSLMYALAKFDNVTVFLACPHGLEMPRHIIDETKNRLRILETNSLTKYLKESQILYATRIQKERFPDEVEYEKVKNSYVVTKELIENNNPKLKIMHALPRINEISPNVDSMESAIYFRQAANGIPVREALLSLLGSDGK